MKEWIGERISKFSSNRKIKNRTNYSEVRNLFMIPMKISSGLNQEQQLWIIFS